MIERVIGAFKDLGFDLDDREIADILWLSVQMRRSESSPLPQLQQQTPASTPEITPVPPQSTINQNKKSPQSSSKTETSTNVYPQSPQDSNQTSSGLPIKVPTAQALRNQLAISRSLKPFKRRVPSKNEFTLDEAATAERIAEEKLLLPVMRPAPERWLELALVIDEEVSMMLWKQTIKEFKQLLERHGAFRDVRTWGLFISEDSKVWLHSRTASASRQKKLHNPRELIDPNGRRLFVIISDCVSPAWRNGTITKALAAWASTSPITIIQVLPEWLWERSALGVADSILLRSLAPGVPNQQLIMTALDLLDESDVVNKLKVPVVTLEPESLRNWAWMVAGAGDVQTKGFLLALDTEIFDIGDESTENTSVELSAKQRLQRFRLTASPMARKLAGLLAAAPVSLPVVRLIRQTMLPQSSQVHVAEVFLGGILKPLSPINEGVDADKIQYEFVDGVRDLLLDAVPLTESTEVLRKVSEYVAQRVGLSVDEFTAMLVNPSLAVDDSSRVLIRPFAQITAKVLRRFGGRYAEVAQNLEQPFQSFSQSIITPQKSNTKFWRNVYRLFKPEEPLVMAEDLRNFYVERDNSPVNQLVSLLEMVDDPAKFLLVGHRGGGTTTELRRFQQEVTDYYNVIWIDTQTALDRYNIGYAEVIVLIGLEIARQTIQSNWFFNKKDELLNALQDSLKTVVYQDQDSETYGWQLPDFLTKVGLVLKRGLTREVTKTLNVRPLLSEIIVRVNDIIEAAEKERKQRLLIIVDGLDRHDQVTALEMFSSPLLVELNSHIIYSIPIYLRYSPSFREPMKNFNKCFDLNNPPVFECDANLCPTNNPNQHGREILIQVINSRLLKLGDSYKGLFNPDALELICEKSGGVMRDLVRLARITCEIGLRKKLNFIDLETAKEAVQEVRREYNLSDYHYPELVLIHRTGKLTVNTHRLPNKGEFIISDELLQSKLVLGYYNSSQESWFDINPILIEDLQRWQAKSNL